MYNNRNSNKLDNKCNINSKWNRQSIGSKKCSL